MAQQQLLHAAHLANPQPQGGRLGLEQGRQFAAIAHPRIEVAAGHAEGIAVAGDGHGRDRRPAGLAMEAQGQGEGRGRRRDRPIELTGLQFLLQLLPTAEDNRHHVEVLLAEEAPIQGQGQGGNIKPRQIAQADRGRRSRHRSPVAWASASASPSKPGCLGFAPALPEPALLLQKANQFAAQGVIVGVLHHLQALARPGQGHLENLADAGLGAVGEHHDPIGEQQGLIHIVGHHHRGDPSLLADLHQLLLEIAPGEGIQGTKRLIQEQQLGPDRQGPGNGNPLLHAAGEFGRAFISGRAKSHQLDVGFHNRGAFLPASISHDGINRQGDVLANALPGQQGIVLEHHHAIGTRIGDLAAVHQDAPLAGLGQARH